LATFVCSLSWTMNQITCVLVYHAGLVHPVYA